MRCVGAEWRDVLNGDDVLGPLRCEYGEWAAMLMMMMMMETCLSVCLSVCLCRSVSGRWVGVALICRSEPASSHKFFVILSSERTLAHAWCVTSVCHLA